MCVPAGVDVNVKCMQLVVGFATCTTLFTTRVTTGYLKQRRGSTKKLPRATRTIPPLETHTAHWRVLKNMPLGMPPGFFYTRNHQLQMIFLMQMWASYPNEGWQARLSDLQAKLTPGRNTPPPASGKDRCGWVPEAKTW